MKSNPHGFTPHMMSMMGKNIFDYHKAYIPQPTLIDKPDMRNRGGLLHNNVGDNLMNEYVSEYTVHINSADRDYSAFYNPFNFTVTYGGIGQTVEKRFRSDGTFERIMCSGQPKPKIARSFKNVKYVKLNHVIVPKTNVIEKITGTDDEIEYSLGDTSTELSMNFKYLVLKIKDIGNNRVLSTNESVDDDSFILYPDKIMGANHWMWLPTVSARVFPNSALANIDKMIFELQDDEGNLLFVMDADDNRLNTKTIYDGLVEDREEGDPVLLNFHRIHKAMQIDIEITIGVVENEYNTHTKFSS
jgi:hypothetical protein